MATMVLIETERATPASRGKDTALRDWVRALESTAPIAANPHRLLPGIIEQMAQTCGEAPALLSAGESLTYRELAARANVFARWALDQGLAKGETVCLMMPNRPEYLAIWLGLTRVGIVVALVNTNLRGVALAHCIDIVAPKHVIAAAEFAAEVRSALPLRAAAPKIWAHGDGSGGEFDRIDRAVERFAGRPLTGAECRDVTIADRALLIYTSGTTGLPKAVNVSHRRILQWSFWFAGLMNTGPDDRMYDCLPLYHSVGGVVATGAVLVRGGSVLIREKFSAQRFWDDVVDGDCTLLQYIGELARYLVNAPKNPRERAHRLRICCGNGLRADVWEKFQQRFAIPRILEFYAATEGNVSLYNVEGQVGAIGRVPLLPRPSLPAGAGEKRRHLRRTGARCRRLVHPLRHRRSRRSARPHPRRRRCLGRRLRGLHQRRGFRAENPARRVRTRRRLVPHRRPDAHGRLRLLLFRRSDRRYLPLEGRECVDHGSRRGDRGVSRHPRGKRLRRPRARHRRRRRHGGDCQRRRVGCCGIAQASRAPAAALCAPAVPAHHGPHRGDRHLQAHQERSEAPRLRSGGDRRSDFL